MPNSLTWEDGTPATVHDFARHQLDTHTLRSGRNGEIEQHFFPDIVAEVEYDWIAKDWIVKGPGVTTTALELPNPDATDDQITAELYTFPIVYRARIVRITSLSVN
ncbi:MAG: hypothetical protein WA708_19615 [Acidobacteriaceae bacterium]